MPASMGRAHGPVEYGADGRPFFRYQDTGEQFFLSPFAQRPKGQEGVPLEAYRATATAQRDATPGGGFLRGQPEWDTKTGQWKRPVAGGNLLALGVGGMMTAPFAASALGGLGGGGGAAAGGGMPALSSPASVLPAGGSGMIGAGGGSSVMGALKTGADLYGKFSDLGKVASGMSEGRSKGRALEAGVQMDYDTLNQRAQQQQLRQLLMAEMLGGAKPPTDPRASGFMSSPAISPETLALITSRAQQPAMSPLPQAGKTDSILNTLGMAGQIGGALGGGTISKIGKGLGKVFGGLF